MSCNIVGNTHNCLKDAVIITGGNLSKLYRCPAIPVVLEKDHRHCVTNKQALGLVCITTGKDVIKFFLVRIISSMMWVRSIVPPVVCNTVICFCVIRLYLDPPYVVSDPLFTGSNLSW